MLWFLGFLAYRVLMGVDLPLGSTLPDMVITMLLTLGWALVFEKKRLKKA